MAEFYSLPRFLNYPQATCWEALANVVVPAIDIPCRVQVKRVKVPLLRVRLRIIRSDPEAYFVRAQMVLRRIFSLGTFGPRFWLYCIHTGNAGCQFQLKADDDAYAENRFFNSIVRAEYRVAEVAVDAMQGEKGAYRKVLDESSYVPRIYFRDECVYTFRQLTHEQLREGFHTQGLDFLVREIGDALERALRERHG